MSQWVAGFTGSFLTHLVPEMYTFFILIYLYTDGISAGSNECLDPSSERWITDCFNEAEMHLCNKDLYVGITFTIFLFLK